MIPKEKAKELVDKFIPYTMEYEEGSDMLFFEDKDTAKQCALICVEEILNDTLNPLVFEAESEFYIYWDEVKQEINLL